MSPNQPLISRIAADVLTGYYKRKRLTQEDLATRSEIPLPTLQKKLKGNAPITATDLVMLSRAIGVDPAKVLTEIVEESEVAERRSSMTVLPPVEDVVSVPVASLDEQRQLSLADMPDEELEGLRNAANTDPEIGHPEPESP